MYKAYIYKIKTGEILNNVSIKVLYSPRYNVHCSKLKNGRYNFVHSYINTKKTIFLPQSKLLQLLLFTPHVPLNSSL